MAEVALDVSRFLALCPQFGASYEKGEVTDESIQGAFETACTVLGGAGEGSPFPYDPDRGVTTRLLILYFATCHFLSLDLMPAGQGGRIASASQGSVSTSFDLIHATKEAGQFWMQTPCGQRVWVMAAPYRKGGRVYAGRGYHPWG